MGAKIDLTGKRFGRLVVLEESDRRDWGHVVWKCRCDCGKISIVDGGFLRRGMTKSCGCGRHGELCHFWKGGVVKQRGRWLIRVPDHPNANAGYEKRARLVVEDSIGRYLDIKENVHHINGNITDDRIENLAVMSRSEHMKLHNELRKLSNIKLQ